MAAGVSTLRAMSRPAPRRRVRSRRFLAAGTALLLALMATACGDDDGDAAGGTDTGGGEASVTVYSGRSEELIQPVFDAFSADTGIDVDVKYGDSAELALLIDTEGDRSPADVFVSQSPGAVGFLDGDDRLQALPSELLDRVDPDYRGSDGTWVGVTGRVRTLVYNTELVDEADLPDSVLDLTDPVYAGQVALAPTNGSFQDFVTAMRMALGDDATLAWLEGMAANDAPTYDRNSAIVEAVSRGEVPMGLVNHYYVFEFLEEDPGAPIANHYFPSTDLGALLITTGTGVLDTSDDVEASQRLIDYFLSPPAQELFSAGEGEYPLIADVPAPEGMPPLSGIGYSIDLDELGGGLERTTEMIRESGLS